ncbi:hypothetical protein SpCBS45565_g04783 [Spizellomyces sp. 'palustris']|nr:hypothetical protein SpCBS45565_g04783 [Spizellomyces sp. 'palustris']
MHLNYYSSLAMMATTALAAETVQLDFRYAGCYEDDPSGNNHIFPVNLGTLSEVVDKTGQQGTLEACLQMCDSYGLTACGVIPQNKVTNGGGLCLGGPWTGDWRKGGVIPDQRCSTPCPLRGKIDGGCGGFRSLGFGFNIAVYEVGRGNGSISYQGTPSTPLPAEVGPEDRAKKWYLEGCYQSIKGPPGLSTILTHDVPPEDCLAACAQRGMDACSIGPGGRICFGDTINATQWQKSPPSECDNACRYKGTGLYNSCGGNRDNGIRISLYKQGELPNELMPPPSTPFASNSSQSTETDNSRRGMSAGAIVGIVLAVLILFGTLLFILRRRTITRTHFDDKPKPGFSKRFSPQPVVWELPKIRPISSYDPPSWMPDNAKIAPLPACLASKGTLPRTSVVLTDANSAKMIASSTTLSQATGDINVFNLPASSPAVPNHSMSAVDVNVIEPLAQGSRAHVAPWEA